MMKTILENLYFLNMRKSSGTPFLIKGVSLTAGAMALGLGLSACSEGTSTAGGGPSGTEAGNAITAQIYNADKTPAAHAKVKVMESASLDSQNAYTAEADKNGKVSIEGVAKGDYILEAKQGANALQLNISVKDEPL
ncbi:MAG: hypothetical protein HUK19_00130, partial [Fibrobacter sp.]|nr:hypothetical protein [Fibrobacter sp.]